VARILPISEVKTRFPELVSDVDEREEEIVVTRKGKPVAVVVNYAEFERLKDTLEVLADPELMRQIARSKAFFSRGGRGLSFEDVFDEPIAPGPKGRRRRRG
jgi:prevent-host-death family protein